MSYAPIALFTYSRADHTKRAVESLLQNAEAKDSELFVFSDGPKTPTKAAAVQENRDYIHTITGFKSVTIIERETNWGLANSLIAGISEVINKYEKMIVVEDDLVLSPFFLQFMNEGLEKYIDDERVGAISGFVYPVQADLPENFFLRYFNCWGWAIWKRSWELLNTDTKYLLRKMRLRKDKFDIGGAGCYGNLYCQKVGLVDSWWVRLYASLFLAGKLTLHPGKSLTSNEGFDGSGTHSGKTNTNVVTLSQEKVPIIDIPVSESEEAYNAYYSYFSSRTRTTSFIQKMKSVLRRLLYIDCI